MARRVGRAFQWLPEQRYRSSPSGELPPRQLGNRDADTAADGSRNTPSRLESRDGLRWRPRPPGLLQLPGPQAQNRTPLLLSRTSMKGLDVRTSAIVTAGAPGAPWKKPVSSSFRRVWNETVRSSDPSGHHRPLICAPAFFVAVAAPHDLCCLCLLSH